MTGETAPAGQAGSPATAGRADARTAAAVTIAVVLLFALSRVAILGIPTEREYDEGVYLLSARALLSGHALFSDVFSAQPPAFLESLAAAMRLAGDSLETGRSLMLGFALIALAAIADIARRIGGTWAAPAAAAALAIGGTFLDLSHLVQSELPAIAVALVSLSACFRARSLGWHRGWLVAAGGLFALSAMYKLMVAPLAVPLGLLLMLPPGSTPGARWSLDEHVLVAAARRAFLVACGAAVVVCVPLLFYDAAPMVEQTISFHLAKNDSYEHHPWGNLFRAGRYLLGNPATSATAVVGMIIVLRTNLLLSAWLLCWFLASLLVLSGQAPLFWRHFIVLAPAVALAAAAVPARIASGRSTAWALATTAVAITLWLGTSIFGYGRATYPLLPASHPEVAVTPMLEVARWIRANTAAGEMIAGDDQMSVYLSGRQAPPALCDTSMARIAVGSLTLAAAIEETATARVVILRKKGRLSRLKGYPQWVARNYEMNATRFSTQRTFWIRKNGA